MTWNFACTISFTFSATCNGTLQLCMLVMQGNSGSHFRLFMDILKIDVWPFPRYQLLSALKVTGDNALISFCLKKMQLSSKFAFPICQERPTNRHYCLCNYYKPYLHKEKAALPRWVPVKRISLNPSNNLLKLKKLIAWMSFFYPNFYFISNM